MELSEKHIEEIRSSFAKMQSKKDLLVLLNEAKNYLYEGKGKPLLLKTLTYYANPAISKKRYTSFKIKKKSGGERTINGPVKGFKPILRSLNLVLQCVYDTHELATGFIPGKSIVDNARIHAGNHYVYNIDLKDFFFSFDRNKVKLGIMFAPNGLGKDREFLSFFIASLCTHPIEIEGKIRILLPQGSPTSPTLTNILCRDLDRRLHGLAKRFGASYSRYADDITFSSLHNIYNKEDFQNELKRIICENQGFEINQKKVRLQKTEFRQEATGLVINEKVNVRRRYIKQLRMWLYYWEKYGYEKAEKIFLNDYKIDKGHIKKGKPDFVNVLSGKLEFIKMIRGKDDSLCNKLEARFLKLLDEMQGIPNLNKVLDVWEKEGIEIAMDKFNLITE